MAFFSSLYFCLFLFLLLGFQLIDRTSLLEARNVNKQKEAADDVDDDDDGDAAERSL